MQVSAVMNSYMLPHGARCTASPRVTIAITCASMPSALSDTATRIHGPASHMDLKAPGRFVGSAGIAGGTGSPGPSTEPPTDPAPAADPAPTVASCATAGAAAFAAAALRG